MILAIAQEAIGIGGLLQMPYVQASLPKGIAHERKRQDFELYLTAVSGSAVHRWHSPVRRLLGEEASGLGVGDRPGGMAAPAATRNHKVRTHHLSIFSSTGAQSAEARSAFPPLKTFAN